ATWVASGYHPTLISGCEERGRDRYIAFWVKEPAQELPATGQPVAALAGFDEAMRHFMRERGVRAGVLAVVKDGRLVLQRGYGYADVRSKVHLAPDAPMRLASISKVFTNAAVARLIRDGKLDRQARVAERLGLKPPAGKEMNPRWRGITIG